MNFPRVTIDLDALRSNLGVVRRCAPHSHVMAAVKANAYGHGLVACARALTDADAFGLARINEALVLRAAGVTKRLVLLEGVVSAADLAAAAAHRLDVVVHALEQVGMLESHRGGERVDVWLKLDTGMHRLGLPPADFVEAHRRVRACTAVGAVRVMTHLAMAEALDDPFTRRQIDAFEASTRDLDLERSIANSAGIIGWPQTRVEWVRPGIMLYGVSPMAGASAADLGLQPVMTLSTQLIAVNRVAAGDAVGYGGLWKAERDGLIGIAAIGYGDGYPRRVNGAAVLVKGHEALLAGRVSMDMIAIDLSSAPDARVGDEVVLWGRGLPI